MTLQATTSKSACIDIPSPYDMELIDLYKPHKIPTGYYGLIPPGTIGLILGRSSCTMRGLVVLTDVVDEDYEGEIPLNLSLCSYYVPTSVPSSRVESGQNVQWAFCGGCIIPLVPYHKD